MVNAASLSLLYTEISLIDREEWDDRRSRDFGILPRNVNGYVGNGVALARESPRIANTNNRQRERSPRKSFSYGFPRAQRFLVKT